MDKSVFKPTPREKHPDPVIRGDKITGDRYYSKEFMQKEGINHDICSPENVHLI